MPRRLERLRKTTKSLSRDGVNIKIRAWLYSKNKFGKLVHLVGFIIRIYHDTRSPERQISI